MGFKTGAYAKVWSCEKGKGNYYIANISTSKKNRDGQYEKDWGSNVMLVGEAAKAAVNGLPDRVRIGECDVTNKYDKEKKIMYTNYTVFSFQDGEAKGQTQQAKQPQQKQSFMDVPDGTDEELPFA